jgi:UDP-N-acetylglucosamine diphosphorylase / glucose-1-phosphate thymidylyltransferase / UDP-N-acetylgalactosamine diphosphorylase / glucosamine-1-phosphate N-acetyltransferase / galactosamine-1-phosphate N-acetyltransferase
LLRGENKKCRQPDLYKKLTAGVDMKPYNPQAFFDLDNALAAELFKGIEYVWDAVAALPAFIEKSLKPEIKGEVEEGAWLEPGMVSLGEGSRVERGSIIRGPTIIGRNTVIRSGAYIRGHVLICDECVVGWATEMRQVLLLNKAHTPHSNAVMTSLIGNRVNMAGRVSTANCRLDGKEVPVRVPVDGRIVLFSTGQTLFGAVVGDDTQVGGNALLQPGAVIGRRCIVYPHIDVSGYVPHDSIVKRKETPFEIIPRK